MFAFKELITCLFIMQTYVSLNNTPNYKILIFKSVKIFYTKVSNIFTLLENLVIFTVNKQVVFTAAYRKTGALPDAERPCLCD